MWNTIFRITDGAVTKQFDLLDVIFFSVGWLLFGTMLGLGEPARKIFTMGIVLAVIYVLLHLLISYIRHLCIGRITNTDPFYGGSE